MQLLALCTSNGHAAATLPHTAYCTHQPHAHRQCSPLLPRICSQVTRAGWWGCPAQPMHVRDAGTSGQDSTGILGQHAVVAFPKFAAEPCAPAHSKLRLMMPCTHFETLQLNYTSLTSRGPDATQNTPCCTPLQSTAILVEPACTNFCNAEHRDWTTLRAQSPATCLQTSDTLTESTCASLMGPLPSLCPQKRMQAGRAVVHRWVEYCPLGALGADNTCIVAAPQVPVQQGWPNLREMPPLSAACQRISAPWCRRAARPA